MWLKIVETNVVFLLLVGRFDDKELPDGGRCQDIDRLLRRDRSSVRRRLHDSWETGHPL